MLHRSARQIETGYKKPGPWPVRLHGPAALSWKSFLTSAPRYLCPTPGRLPLVQVLQLFSTPGVRGRVRPARLPGGLRRCTRARRKRAGDHKGPPRHSSPPSPLRELKPLRERKPLREANFPQEHGELVCHSPCRAGLQTLPVPFYVLALPVPARAPGHLAAPAGYAWRAAEELV